MNELDVEIFAVGQWNGVEFGKEDLNLMAVSFDALTAVHKVPLKFGHNDDQPFTDGQPALGWVGKVWVSGTKLMAKFIEIPDVVYTAMQKKLYKHVSIELDMGVEHKGNYYELVLSGVALLGADIPAVNTLADLTSYMSKELTFKKRAVFTAAEIETKSKGDSMGDSEEVKTLKAQIAAKDEELGKLVTNNTALEQGKIEMKAKFTSIEANDKLRKDLEERKTLEARLEAMVTSKKIAPFTRDDYLRDYDQADDTVKATIVYSVKSLEKTIDANPAYFGAEQARLKASQEKDETEMDAGQVVVDRSHKYMADHGEKSFSVAKLAVLRADMVLADRYTKGVH